MKKLSKIIGIVLFVIVSVSIHAENIDECKSDLYFANGIMMKYSEKDALDMWKEVAGDLLVSKPDLYAKIANIKISYNISQGFLDDLLESFEQVMSNEWGWVEFSTFFEQFLTSHNIQEDWVPHIKDLVKQTKSYKDSIKLGHNVIVIAHSQGNYYTNEAYDLLDGWMKPYFHMMGVATPANHVAGDGPYVKFHNDFIKSVVTGLPSNRIDPNSNHNQTFSIAAHDFYESYLSAVNTRSDIQKFIFNKVKEHEKSPTQWETDEEFERNTCNYRITLKHRFDPSIEVGGKVYPFNGSKKLYQVNGEYVKASCGGENILSSWEGKKDDECWMIDNPQNEKIIARKKHYFSIGNPGTVIVSIICNAEKPYFTVGVVNEQPLVVGDDEYGTNFYESPHVEKSFYTSCDKTSKSDVDKAFVSLIKLTTTYEEEAMKILVDKYGQDNIKVYSNGITKRECDDSSFGDYGCLYRHDIKVYVYY